MILRVSFAQPISRSATADLIRVLCEPDFRENDVASRATDPDRFAVDETESELRMSAPLSNSAITFIAEPCTRSDAIPVNIHVNHDGVHSIKHYPPPRDGEWIRALDRKPAAAA